MNVIQRMEAKKEEFTQNHLLIYQKISEDPGLYVQMTTSALAEACGVSQPALTRFVKDLGYARYQDFRADLIQWLAEQRTHQTLNQEVDRLDYFSVLDRLLQDTEKLLTDSYMRDLSSYMKGFRRIFATGIAKSYQPAALMEILLLKSSTFVHAISSDSLGELSDAMTEEDLMIVFSVSGSKRVFQDLSESSAKILLVTANPSAYKHTHADRCVVLPYVPPTPEESSVSPVLFDIFVEILCKYLV